MKEKLAFIGTGIIGAGLAVNAMVAGFDAVLYDVADLQVAKDRVKGILDNMVDAGAFDAAAADAAFARATFTNDLKEACEGATFVQEAIPERLDLKQSTYKQIQEITGPAAIIASTTSALMPSDLQAGALYPDRIMVAHPYNPSYLIPLVEICAGKETSEEAMDKVREMYTAFGKVVIRCLKESVGFLAQPVNWGVKDIAFDLIKKGLGTPEDIDKAIMYGPGMRFAISGQLLTLALGVEGGWANMSRKYSNTEPTDFDLWLNDEVNKELANRPEQTGNTVETAIAFRDKMLVAMLKFQGMM